MTSDTTPAELPANFAGLKFDNRYARLPQQFYARVTPTPVREPGLIKVNHELARELNLDPAILESEQGVAMLAGNAVPGGAEPLAQAYAGHQFGYLNPQLGDGRAILLGEVRDRNGRIRDLQLKGAGPTPFSRRGDGRAALGPVIREYLVSEAMHALGIRTTRALAAVTTGDQVYRESVLPGAVLTRVAASHIRIGTFEYLRGREDTGAIKQLADFVIERHYPDVAQAANPYRALLDAVINAQASLVASWLHIGFVHGVMNTDNMSISGETIDYGPCAFMERYDPTTVFSSIDTGGRYAYGRQPNIALWNLSRFAECLLPLFDPDQTTAISQAEEQLTAFPRLFDRYWLQGMRRKLGLAKEAQEDQDLIESLLQIMQVNQADYTQSFRRLAKELNTTDPEQAPSAELAELFCQETDALRAWLARWKSRLEQEGQPPEEVAQRMRLANPAYIPRNLRVEAVIDAAVNGDYQPFHEMVEVLSNPYEEQQGREIYAAPAPVGEQVYKTFCGT